MATEHSNQRIIFCIRFNYEMHPLGTSRLDIVDFSLHLCQGTRTTEGVHDTVITDTSLHGNKMEIMNEKLYNGE